MLKERNYEQEIIVLKQKSIGRKPQSTAQHTQGEHNRRLEIRLFSSTAGFVSVCSVALQIKFIIRATQWCISSVLFSAATSSIFLSVWSISVLLQFCFAQTVFFFCLASFFWFLQVCESECVCVRVKRVLLETSNKLQIFVIAYFSLETYHQHTAVDRKHIDGLVSLHHNDK